MNGMTMNVWEHTSLLVVAALVTFGLAWLGLSLAIFAMRRLADAREAQVAIMDRFYDQTARFYKETSDEKHGWMRRVVGDLAESLSSDKGRFAKRIFLYRAGKLPMPAKPPAKVQAEFEALNPQARDALGNVLGNALLASTFDLFFAGPLIRRGLVADSAEPCNVRVHETTQVVYNVTRANAAIREGKHHPKEAVPA